jgi:hypothetical protein
MIILFIRPTNWKKVFSLCKIFNIQFEVSTNFLLRTVISGFRREVDENCAVLGYHAASSGYYLPTFRDNVSVPSSRFKNQGFKHWILEP